MSGKQSGVWIPPGCLLEVNIRGLKLDREQFHHINILYRSVFGEILLAILKLASSLLFSSERSKPKKSLIWFSEQRRTVWVLRPLLSLDEHICVSVLSYLRGGGWREGSRNLPAAIAFSFIHGFVLVYTLLPPSVHMKPEKKKKKAKVWTFHTAVQFYTFSSVFNY